MNRRGTISRTGRPEQNRSLLPPTASFAIPETERGFFESRLGSDFAHVRVHTDERAAMLADSLGAKAFTVDNEIFFAEGQYLPGTTRGRRLLAHELAHVVQQSRAGGAATTDAEPRAHAAADRLTEGHAVSAGSVGSAESGIHCQEDEEKEKAPLPPIVPRLQLDPSLVPPDTWLTLQTSFQTRGLRLSDRDAFSIESEWQRSSQLLDTLGITDSFKLGFITKQWLLKKGIETQVENWKARENPGALDIFNDQFKAAYPDAWQTPIIPIFSTDWFQKKGK